MRGARPIASILRAEAQLLSLAGLILLAVSFPMTLFLVALALEGASPLLPVAACGPLIMLGYLACHFASGRLALAQSLDQGEDFRELAAAERNC